MVKSTMTGTVPSSGCSGTAAVMAQNEQTTEEHSMLEQQPPGRLDHSVWCIVWTVEPYCRIGGKKTSFYLFLKTRYKVVSLSESGKEFHVVGAVPTADEQGSGRRVSSRVRVVVRFGSLSEWSCCCLITSKTNQCSEMNELMNESAVI